MKQKIYNGLKLFHFAYWTSLPILAISANFLNKTNDTLNFWFWLGSSIAIIIYLGIAGELIIFPKNFFQAIIDIISVPIQVLLALIFSQKNIWNIFLTSFVVECLSLLLGVAGYTLIIFRKQSQSNWKKIISILLLLSISIYGIMGVFWQSTIQTYEPKKWPALFLFSALISNMIKYSRRINQRNNGIDTGGHEVANPGKMVLWGLLTISIGLIILEIIREKF